MARYRITGQGNLSRQALLWLWLAAFGLRLLAVSPFLHFAIALDDMFQYDMLARSLVSGQGYRWYARADLEILRPYMAQFLDFSRLDVPDNGLNTTFRPPGYPFFLAAVYAGSEEAHRLPAARLAQCLVGALLAPITAATAARLGLGRRGQWSSGLAMAAYPLLILYPIGLASENLFIPLLAGSVLALLHCRESRSIWLCLLAGGLLGAAMLTRSVAAGFVILAGIWLALCGRLGWRGALLVTGAAFAVCLPWALRNSQVMGRPTFVESSLAFQMYVGYHPEGTGSFVTRAAIEPLSILDDAQREQFCMSKALGFIASDPWGSAGKIFRRIGHFMAVEDRELLYFYTNGYFREIPSLPLFLAYLALILPWIGTCLLAPFGMLALPNRRGVVLLLLLVIGYSLPHLLIIAEPRFHLALVPVLIPCAVAGAGTILRRGRGALWMPGAKQRERLAGAGLLAASLAGCIFVWGWAFAARWSTLLSVFGPGGSQLRFFY